MGFFFKVKRRLLWQILSFLPKDQNKVVLQSYYGRGYGDSPRAICEELRKDKSWKLYWTVKGKAEACSLPEGVTPVKPDSLRGIFAFCTAGFWIDNSRKWSFVQKKPNQYYIQSWHGFALKRIEGDAGDALPEEYIRSAKRDSKMADLFLSDSRFLSDIYRRGFWYDGDIQEEGLPRNDILRFPPEGMREKVQNALSLEPGKKMLLYAPTFRRDCGLEVYDIDYTACVKALRDRFGGDWVILAKLHPNIADKAEALHLDGVHVVNASQYPDIQEMYLAADAMISDYSSTMFDFLLTGKPCFLYVNDMEAYKNDRNFYFDLNKLPFSKAIDNVSLQKIILEFDPALQKSRAEAFIREFGLNETGLSARRAVEKMEAIRKERTHQA